MSCSSFIAVANSILPLLEKAKKATPLSKSPTNVSTVYIELLSIILITGLFPICPAAIMF